jgi:hypothetical protein
MEFHAREVAEILTQVLPGFLTAWIFYSLTAHAKPSPFERIAQALIFTVIVQALLVVVRYILVLVGELAAFSVGSWNDDSRLIWSIVLACLLGLVVSRLTNNDRLHRILRRYNWTLRTSAPSEWYSAFSSYPRWIILNLSGQRRLYGWPEQWPDRSDHGYFILQEPEWLLRDGSRAPIVWDERILVPACEVEFVEFLRERGTIDEDSPEIESIRQLLKRAQEEDSP